MTSKKDSILLPNNLRGRSIHMDVIPTVCNLKNMLEKLDSVEGDVSKLKQWEKRSYKAYKMDKIKVPVLCSDNETRIRLIKEHILNEDPNNLGASCIDMYLVAYVAENYNSGKQSFIEYIIKNGITEKPNSAQAIWQVGKGDGVYLGILNDDGLVQDWEFFTQWVKGKDPVNKDTIQKSFQIHNPDN